MKINRMWAMFDEEGLFRWSIRETRQEVIELVEKNYGMKWRHIYKQIGYRIKKVAVLREAEFEGVIKAAREEVLELARGYFMKTYLPTGGPVWAKFCKVYRERYEQG